MIVLTGTTGNLGSSVLRHMLGLVPPSQLIVSVYNPSQRASEELREKGVQVRAGDYSDPRSLEGAFAGADRLLLVSHPSFSDALRITYHRNAIDAARRAGVKHVYYTSLAFGGESKAAVMQAHLATEAYLRSSGIGFTSLREGLYMESYPIYLGFFDVSHPEVLVPGDGGVAWAARDDLGEATARIVAGGGHEGETLVLAGPRAYSLEQTTALVSSILGREIRFAVVGEEEYVKRHEAKGEVARWWASTYTAIKAGETSAAGPLLEQILGRPPVTLEAKLRELLGAEGKAAAEVSNWLGDGRT